ncbi:MAG: methyltransferase [Acidobacteria bacterium]|nr:MAG: methyltransferase [Acidobacteriota bacterium]
MRFTCKMWLIVGSADRDQSAMTKVAQPGMLTRARGRYDGLLEIISYNRGFYAFTIIGVVAGSLTAAWLRGSLGLLLAGAIVITVAWMLASLAVSHYIYDRSALYDFRWMRERLPRAPRNWVNIHSGLDQTSQILRSVFPNSDGQILDIYDPTEMTEPSIARARALSSGGPKALAADFRHLPLPDSSCDAVFLIFSVHELRQRDSRVEFFQEVARVLAANGTVILVEHLRDPANFLAFGPGFLHFHSRREWLHAAHSADLKVQEEMSVTPFVHVFILVHEHGS